MISHSKGEQKELVIVTEASDSHKQNQAGRPLASTPGTMEVNSRPYGRDHEERHGVKRILVEEVSIKAPVTVEEDSRHGDRDRRLTMLEPSRTVGSSQMYGRTIERPIVLQLCSLTVRMYDTYIWHISEYRRVEGCLDRPALSHGSRDMSKEMYGDATKVMGIQESCNPREALYGLHGNRNPREASHGLHVRIEDHTVEMQPCVAHSSKEIDVLVGNDVFTHDLSTSKEQDIVVFSAALSVVGPTSQKPIDGPSILHKEDHGLDLNEVEGVGLLPKPVKPSEATRCRKKKLARRESPTAPRCKKMMLEIALEALGPCADSASRSFTGELETD